MKIRDFLTYYRKEQYLRGNCMKRKMKFAGLCMFLVLCGGMVAAFIVVQRMPGKAHASGGGQVIFQDNFDSYQPGPLPTGPGADQWSSVGIKGTGFNVAVSNAQFESAPNSLQITLGSQKNGYAWAEKDYTGPGYVEHTVDFNLYLDPSLSLGNQSIALFTAENASQPQNGSAAIWLTSNGHLQVVRYDSQGVKHATGAKAGLSLGQWHAIELNQTNDPQSGSYSLLVDGTQVLGETGIDTGNTLLTTIFAGDKLSSNASLSGLYYEDDVVTSTTTPPPPTVIFQDNFDSYPLGPLPTGPGANQWTKVSIKGAGFGVAVSSAQSHSAPNSLQITLGNVARGHAWAEKDYSGAGYFTHAAQFWVYLDPHLVQGNQAISLFTVNNSSQPQNGSIALWLTPKQHLQIIRYDSLGKKYIVGTTGVLTTGAWFKIEIDQTNDPANGSYALFLNNTQVAGQTGIDTGNIPVTSIVAGDRLISRAGLSGSYYEDDVITATGYIG